MAAFNVPDRAGLLERLHPPVEVGEVIRELAALDLRLDEREQWCQDHVLAVRREHAGYVGNQLPPLG